MGRESSVHARRLGWGTLYKLILIGNICSLVPFALFMGCLSLFGLETVQWNDQPVTGLAGLLASPFVGLLVALAWTLVSGIAMSMGLWLFSLFRTITLRYEKA